MELSKDLQCPSYICKPDAEIFGIVNSFGFIDYLKSTIKVDETFIDEASKGRAPEKRFRFAGKCAKTGCKQWANNSSTCSLVDKVIDVINNEEANELPSCPIRNNCRWFAQRKGLACSNCNEIIRNLESKLLEQGESV